MKPIKTKDTQGTFGNDMPYRFLKTVNGPAFFVTWKGSLLERIKFLLTGKITTITYSRVMPPMNVSID